jgi:hypothetical protein
MLVSPREEVRVRENDGSTATAVAYPPDSSVNRNTPGQENLQIFFGKIFTSGVFPLAFMHGRE